MKNCLNCIWLFETQSSALKKFKNNILSEWQKRRGKSKFIYKIWKSFEKGNFF